jgi:hypothetical protein
VSEVVAEMTAVRPSVDPVETDPAVRKRKGRSRITNGKALLPGIDQRSPWVRRCRDLIREHVSDLGGADNTSAAERSIVRRASVLETELEMLEAKFATAGQASADDLDLCTRASGNLRRLGDMRTWMHSGSPKPCCRTSSPSTTGRQRHIPIMAER